MNEKKIMRLNALKLGLAAGIICGLGLFLLTWISMYSGWGLFWLAQWMDLFPGFDLSIKGAFIGLVYGFVEGFIKFSLIGWLYNRFIPERR